MRQTLDKYDQETAAETFAAEHGAPFDFEPAYIGDGWSSGIAWRAYAYETEPDQDTEWTGMENPTGRILAHMIGDDRTFTFEPDELTPIGEDDYCPGCGQVGCGAYH